MSEEQSLTEVIKRYQASIEKACPSNVVEHSPSDDPVSDQGKKETQLNIVVINGVNV